MRAVWAMAAGILAMAGPAAAVEPPHAETTPADALESVHDLEHDAHDAHAPTFSDINFAYGFLGEKAGVEPSLLWRRPGSPPPLLALLLNAAILYWALYRFGMPRIRDGLKHRRAAIMQGMDEAARMKAEAAKRLAEYEARLEHIDAEIERVKKEMREAGKAEQAHVLAEARERRTRMERDAHLLIEQELKAARETLYAETVHSAVASATAQLEQRLTAGDQQRLAREYLDGVEQAVRTTVGRA